MALLWNKKHIQFSFLVALLLIGLQGATYAANAQPRSEINQKKVLSVVSVRNPTPAAINYQLRWGEGEWKKFVVEPGKTKVHWTDGSNRSAAIRFDASFSEGFQGNSFLRPSLDFLVGGPKGPTPRKAADGALYEFRRSKGDNGLELVAVRTVDRSRNSIFRKDLEANSNFPHLLTNFEVLEPPGKNYNCIAHSMGIHNRWVNPNTGPVANPFGPMDHLYQPLGYHRLPTVDLSLKKGIQKIALYASKNPDGTINKVTHASLQGKDGVWTSKLGKLALIRHVTAEAINGPSYGEPVAVYVRNR